MSSDMPLKEEMAALDAELAAERFPWDESMSGVFRVKKILQVYADLEKVDKATADACTVALYEKLRSANFDQIMKFQKQITATPENLALLLKKYHDFREYVDMMFPSELIDGIDTYPSEMVEAAYETVLDGDLSILDFLEKIGCIKAERV